MGAALICWPNLIEIATLSGGSWRSSLPLSNIADQFLGKVARSTDTTAASTKFSIDLPNATYVKMLALVKHNLDSGATIRVTVYSDQTRTQVLDTTGILRVWPEMYTSEELEWEDDNWWSGTMSEDQIAFFPKVWLHLWSERQYVQYLDVEIFNATNSDGYIEIGGVFLSLDWQPTHNITYGSQLQWNDPSQVETSWNGTEHFSEKTKFRSVVGRLDFMDDIEAVNKALLLTADRGITKSVFFVWDPDDPLLLAQRSFMGRLRNLNPMEALSYLTNGMTIEIKEIA